MPNQEKSRSARADYTRKWRENAYKKKRFNKPLKEYIELKYNSLYCEYCSFFKSIDEKHPQTKDLTKTTTYKKWKRELLKQQESEAELFTFPTEPFTTSSEAGQNDIPNQVDGSEDRNLPERNILAVAAEGIVPTDNEININFINADNIIQEMINELDQDEVVRNLMNEINELGNEEIVIPHYAEHDEGIGLNLEDELDIESFDFQEEVEPFDF